MTSLRRVVAAAQLIIFVFLVAPGRAFGEQPPANGQVPIDVQFIDCAANVNSDAALKVVVRDTLLGDQVVKREIARIIGNPVFSFRMILPPGSYRLNMSAGTCSDSLDLIVLPAHPRKVVAIAHGVMISDLTATLSGVLPVEDAVVMVVYKGLKPKPGLSYSPDGFVQYPASVEGDAYFAVQLPDGRATLRIYNQTRTAWLDFDAGEITNGVPARSNFIHNVSANDITQKINEMKSASAKRKCRTGRKPGIVICSPPS